jgi:hypothetical protein
MVNEEEVMKDVNDSPSLITIYMKDNTVRSIFNGDEKDIEMMEHYNIKCNFLEIDKAYLQRLIAIRIF